MTDTALASAPDDAPTRIDVAWSAAQAQDADQVAEPQELGDVDDAAAAAFVDAILAELLVCPVWDDENGEPPAPEKAEPKLVALESGEALALFDSEERLAAFVDEPSAFIALPGYAFFELAASHGLAIAFNPEVAPSEMVFSPATVAAVAALVSASEEAGDVHAPALAEARAPSGAPPAMMTALQARLAAAKALVKEGWLFEARFSDATAPALVLGVVALQGAAADELRRLSAELSRLGSTLLENGEAMNVALFSEGDEALERIRGVGFGISSLQAAAH